MTYCKILNYIYPHLHILHNKNPIGITGQVKPDEQEKLIEEFKNWNFKDGKGKILVATAGTVAESVSLHRNKDKKHVCNNERRGM